MSGVAPAFAPAFAAVVRPEPGNARTVARLEALGVAVRRLPLFAVRPLDWEPPDPAAFDALLLTSANAPRLAGSGLERLRVLPAVAVGEGTAAAARAAGLDVTVVGDAGVAQAQSRARAAGRARLLHLAGRHRMPDGPGVTAIPVYAAEAVPLPPGAVRALENGVVLLHSARAAARLAAAVAEDGADRGRMALAALGPAVLEAAGPGWAAASRVAARPSDDALCRLAAGMIDARRD